MPHLKSNGGGSIVNISSTAGLFGYPFRTPYAASKWAVIGFTKSLAMELGEFGIRVNAICPGSIEGERMDGIIEREAAAKGVASRRASRSNPSAVFVAHIDKTRRDCRHNSLPLLTGREEDQRPGLLSGW